MKKLTTSLGKKAKKFLSSGKKAKTGAEKEPELVAVSPDHQATFQWHNASAPDGKANTAAELDEIEPELVAVSPDNRATFQRHSAAAPQGRAKAAAEHDKSEPELVAVSPDDQKTIREESAAAPEWRARIGTTKASLPVDNDMGGASSSTSPPGANAASLLPPETWQKLPPLKIPPAHVSESLDLAHDNSHSPSASTPLSTGQATDLDGSVTKDASELNNTKVPIYPSALAGMDESKKREVTLNRTAHTQNAELTDHTLGDDVGWPLKQKTVKRDAKKQCV